MKITNSTLNYTNSANLQNRAQKQQNFGSAYRTIIDAVGKPLGNTYLTGFGDKLSKGIAKFSKLDNATKHLMTAESFIITGVYMGRTAKNKKIEKEQKFPMMLNDFLVTAFATVLGYATDKKIGDKIKEVVVEYKNSIKNNTILKSGILKDLDAEKQMQVAKKIHTKVLEDGIEGITKATAGIIDANTVKKTFNNENIKQLSDSIGDALLKTNKSAAGINALKSIAVFGFIYRFLGPVLMTPIANNLSSKIQHRKDAKPAVQQAAAPVQTANTKPAEQPKLQTKA